MLTPSTCSVHDLHPTHTCIRSLGLGRGLSGDEADFTEGRSHTAVYPHTHHRTHHPPALGYTLTYTHSHRHPTRTLTPIFAPRDVCGQAHMYALLPRADAHQASSTCSRPPEAGRGDSREGFSGLGWGVGTLPQTFLLQRAPQESRAWAFQPDPLLGGLPLLVGMWEVQGGFQEAVGEGGRGLKVCRRSGPSGGPLCTLHLHRLIYIPIQVPAHSGHTLPGVLASPFPHC